MLRRAVLLSMCALASSGCREPAAPALPPLASSPPIATTAPTPSAAAAPAPEPEVALSVPGPELVVRNQPWLRGIRSWDGALVAVADPRGGGHTSYRIEPIDRPERARAVPLVIPGTTRVVDLAVQGEAPVALVIAGGGLALASHRGTSWSIEPVPDPTCAPEDATFAASPGALVVLCPGRLHVRRAGAWKSVPVGPPPVERILASPQAARHALLTADRLLLGFDAGEWGGALVSLDLATAGWKVHREVDGPVRDLQAGVDGRPWVAAGLSHLGGISGSLRRLDAAGWKTVASVEGSAFTAKPTTHAHFGWDLDPASFDAIAFDEENRIHLLTGALGVVRLDGARWTRLTPAWPEHTYVSGLVVRGDFLIIATWDAGVLLWDTATGKARRVELAEAPHAP